MRAHGDRAFYMWGPKGSDRSQGCRCDLCTEANRAYVRMLSKRTVRIAAGKMAPVLVDVADAREHLRWLSTQGIGVRTVARRVGVNTKTIADIRNGNTKRARPGTVQAIMAIGTHVATDGVRIDATRTWRLIDELLSHGFTRRQIAAELGSKSANPSLQLERTNVTVRNARKVEDVHARLIADVIAKRERDRNHQRAHRARSAA